MLVIYMCRCPDPTDLYALLSPKTRAQPGPRPSASAMIPFAPVRPASSTATITVAVQMADNRISTSYYWQHDDLDMPWDGGRKYIAGTFFREG